VEDLYRAREPLYREAATIRIDSSHLTHRQTAEAVLATLQQQQAQQQ
jgi:shikimate kinase